MKNKTYTLKPINKKRASKLLDSNKNYLSIPDSSDWKFDNKDFTICGFYWKDKNGKFQFKNCSCKNWKKCKGFKNEKIST